MEAICWADDLLVVDQDKIPGGNSASTDENNASRAKLSSRLQEDFVFDHALAEVDEEVDSGDFLFDTSLSLRRLSAMAGSNNSRPSYQPQNPNPGIQPSTKPSFLIWKQREDRPANLGLPHFPLLEEEEEEIVVAEEGRSMLIPPEPTTTAAPGFWNSFDFTDISKLHHCEEPM
jgi:hypothetical protein